MCVIAARHASVHPLAPAPRLLGLRARPPRLLLGLRARPWRLLLGRGAQPPPLPVTGAVGKEAEEATFIFIEKNVELGLDTC
jgi:hypothetical protein